MSGAGPSLRRAAGWLTIAFLFGACTTSALGSHQSRSPATVSSLARGPSGRLGVRQPLSLPGAVVQPRQATSGPGGSAYSNADWRVSHGGVGPDAWYAFEPIKPQPRIAPIAIVMHGYYEFDGYDQLYEFIRHTVRKGSIVIYPRWQTGVTTPCPGPFDIEPCITSAVSAIHAALRFLQSDPTRVHPRLDQASYFGFSFGGIITADLANRYASLELPEPRVIFLDDPHDGGLNGTGEPALDNSLGGIPASAKVECHSGADGVIGEAGMANSSCNAVFPKLDHIPPQNKDLVLTETDMHGSPTLSSGHGVCMSPKGHADAYDWGFCWKVWDGLRRCAFSNRDCQYALGPTPQHRSNGTWSDGIPIKPLKIQNSAPIRG